MKSNLWKWALGLLGLGAAGGAVYYFWPKGGGAAALPPSTPTQPSRTLPGKKPSSPTPSPVPSPVPSPGAVVPAPATSPTAPSVPMVAAPAGQQGIVTTQKDPLSLRSGPGTNYAIIGSLPRGATIAILGRNADGSWYNVNFAGKGGWASAQYITLAGGNAPAVSSPAQTTAAANAAQAIAQAAQSLTSSPADATASVLNAAQQLANAFTPTPAPAVQTGTITTQTDPLRLRAAPSTTATVLTLMPKGSTVTILGTSGDWYNVSYAGKTGWASKSYITLNPSGTAV